MKRRKRIRKRNEDEVKKLNGRMGRGKEKGEKYEEKNEKEQKIKEKKEYALIYYTIFTK